MEEKTWNHLCIICLAVVQEEDVCNTLWNQENFRCLMNDQMMRTEVVFVNDLKHKRLEM